MGPPPDSNDGLLVRAVLDEVPCGVAVHAPDGRLVFVNTAAAQLLGRCRWTDLLGRTDTGAALSDERGEALAVDDWPTRRVLERRDEQAELRIRCSSVPNGGLLLRVRAWWCSAPGHPGGLVITTLHDVTDEGAMKAEAGEARREAAHWREAAGRASGLRRELLSIVSHELRTPLSAILGWAGILLPRAGDEMSKRGLEAIERNARLESLLVSDLLDLASVSSGQLELARARVDVAAAVTSAAEAFASPAEEARVVLDIDATEGECFACADRHRLEQIVASLISNAIKFTPAGGAVRVRVLRWGSIVAIEVEDTGPGIDAAFAPDVFEPFRQAEPSATRAHGGLGVGLALAQHLTHAHGGSIEVVPRGAGAGALFRVRLPAAEP